MVVLDILVRIMIVSVVIPGVVSMVKELKDFLKNLD